MRTTLSAIPETIWPSILVDSHHAQQSLLYSIFSFTKLAQSVVGFFIRALCAYCHLMSPYVPISSGVATVSEKINYFVQIHELCGCEPSGEDCLKRLGRKA
jgi:hypothetical protein